MAEAKSTANATWEGDLIHGKGTFSLESGVLTDTPVTWAGRTARTKGMTSPEELLAAAHAACYCMALSHTLAQRGTPPTSLHATAVATFVPGTGVTSVDLSVSGQVPGLDQAGFEEAARAGEQGCPISNAIRNNVAINLTARLES
jgi:osmotically inducible protein OsmC